MKTYFKFLAIVILIASTSINAQKRDRETLGWLKYVQNPTKPISDSYKSYTVIAQGASDDDYRTDEITNKFNFAGFKKVNSDVEFDLKFNIKEYNLRVEVPTDELSYKRKETKVKKDGVESTVITYYYKNSFTYKYVLKMYNKENEEIYSKTIAGTKDIVGADNKSTKVAREAYFKSMSKAKSSILGEAVSALNTTVNDTYGYPVKQMSAVGFKIKPKKFEYDELNNAVDLLESSVKLSNENNQNITEFEENINSVITVCTTEIATLEDNKKARINPKAAAGAYYNIAMSNILLKQYEPALEALKKGRALDKGVGNASYVETLLNNLIERDAKYKRALTNIEASESNS